MSEARPRSATPVVLQVLPALQSGGVERGTIEIVQALSREGARPLVASSGGRLVAAVKHAGGEHFTLPLASKNPVLILSNAARLAALIKAEGVQIIHARSRAPAWSALLAARWTRTHFITTYHAVYKEDLPGKRYYNSVMAKGEMVIAISEFVAQAVAARHKVPAERIRVIPRGVDLSAFTPEAIGASRLTTLLNRWALPEGAKVVMLPGRLTRWKGHRILLEALALLRRNDLCCVFVGAEQRGKHYVKELLQYAGRLGLTDQLRIVGHCDDMPAALMLADIVVNPSVEPEGFGRVVIEGQAMGRIVIAADHGGAVETVTDGETGFRIPPANAEALACVLDRALEMTANERLALAHRARAAVVAHFTTAALQNATLSVYHSVLSREPHMTQAPVLDLL